MEGEVIFDLLVDFHRDGERQGPGSEEETVRALELARLERSAQLRVADIGCGTGASTLVLAGELPNAAFVAVDLFPQFLDILARIADESGYSDRVETLAGSMEALPFATESMDVIWSEGAVYNMGFAAGVATWRQFLKPGGVLAVSEITWLQPDPPEELRMHWRTHYPEIATASEKIAVLERVGYDLLGYLLLPETAWMDNYYEPAERRIPAFLERHPDRADALELVEMERREAELYRQYRNWFSYGFYVARKR